MMTFDHDELALVRTTLRHALESNDAAELPKSLLAEGWTDLVDADAAGAITALAEEAGAARSNAPILDVAVLWAVDRDDIDTTAVCVNGLALAGAERASRVVGVSDSGLSSVAAADIRLEPAGGFDPDLGLQRVTGTVPAGAATDADAARACAVGRLALASQMAGAVDQMLADTLAYVTEREQYGRAIGSFQSVKHRLADVKVAVTAARAAIATAWAELDTEDGSTLARSAKCLAGRAQTLASTHCFQVHGGIAFTVEHGFESWVRRGLLLDLLLGDQRELQREVGSALIERNAVPRVPQLY
jgi:alkylation response protein AidB-like acyl-CoA dehydrogenase